MAYEFVEAFSSVPPKIRISQIIAILALLGDIAYRFASGNLFHPSFVDIPACPIDRVLSGETTKCQQADADKEIKMD